MCVDSLAYCLYLCVCWYMCLFCVYYICICLFICCLLWLMAHVFCLHVYDNLRFWSTSHWDKRDPFFTGLVVYLSKMSNWPSSGVSQDGIGSHTFHRWLTFLAFPCWDTLKCLVVSGLIDRNGCSGGKELLGLGAFGGAWCNAGHSLNWGPKRLHFAMPMPFGKSQPRQARPSWFVWIWVKIFVAGFSKQIRKGFLQPFQQLAGAPNAFRVWKSSLTRT